MNAVLLMPPVLVPELRTPLHTKRGTTIDFLAVYLIHEDELALKLSSGLDDLVGRFAWYEITELYDPKRPSVLSERD